MSVGSKGLMVCVGSVFPRGTGIQTSQPVWVERPLGCVNTKLRPFCVLPTVGRDTPVWQDRIIPVAGAIFGTHVAKTIGAGIVEKTAVTQEVILCALIGAIIWNLLTWLFGIPSSSSHALIGGLVGAAVAHCGFAILHLDGLINKVIIPMFASPLIRCTCTAAASTSGMYGNVLATTSSETSRRFFVSLVPGVPFGRA